MKKLFFAFLLTTALFIHAEEAADDKEHDLDKVSPQEFLQVVRDPLRTDAWGEITGRITYAHENSALRKGAPSRSICRKRRRSPAFSISASNRKI